MTILDILVATYLGWAFYRDRHRGLRAETARIVGLTLTLNNKQSLIRLAQVTAGIQAGVSALLLAFAATGVIYPDK